MRLLSIVEWFNTIGVTSVKYDNLPISYPQLFQGILDNINVPGGLPGLSIASPSTDEPNYYYHWVRDGALNIGSILDEISLSGDSQLGLIVDDYIQSSITLQKVPNLSGSVGEPKFYVDGKPFNGPWGRPQNDGPALRAMVTIKWIKDRPVDEIKQIYDAFIQTDLNYISRNWALPSFDLWEELYGYHFFTSVCQYGALKAGAIIAGLAGNDQDALRFSQVGDKVADFIRSNYLPGRFTTRDYVSEHFPSNLGSRRGLDAATVIAILELDSLAGWTTSLDGIDLAFTLDSDGVKQTIEALIADMTPRFPINNGQPGGIGRYPEDMYDGISRQGGNPWFICTAAVAEALTRLGQQPRATPLLQFILNHRGQTLSEQMDKHTGFMTGAQNLTWSYSAVLRAFRAYNEPQSLRLWNVDG